MAKEHLCLIRGLMIAALIVAVVVWASNFYDKMNSDVSEPQNLALVSELKLLKQHSRALIKQGSTFLFPVRTAEQELLEQQQYLAEQITARYTKVDPALAEEIVKYAHQYEHDIFPKAQDILAIIGVESSFRPNVASSLKKDPALGLMQVRAKVWSHKVDRQLMDQVEYQIKYGSEILAEYYQRNQGDVDGAVQSYNIGITAYRKGREAPKYLDKYRQELAYFSQEPR